MPELPNDLFVGLPDVFILLECIWCSSMWIPRSSFDEKVPVCDFLVFSLLVDFDLLLLFFDGEFFIIISTTF